MLVPGSKQVGPARPLRPCAAAAACACVPPTCGTSARACAQRLLVQLAVLPAMRSAPAPMLLLRWPAGTRRHERAVWRRQCWRQPAVASSSGMTHLHAAAEAGQRRCRFAQLAAAAHAAGGSESAVDCCVQHAWAVTNHNGFGHDEAAGGQALAIGQECRRQADRRMNDCALVPVGNELLPLIHHRFFRLRVYVFRMRRCARPPKKTQHSVGPPPLSELIAWQIC